MGGAGDGRIKVAISRREKGGITHTQGLLEFICIQSLIVEVIRKHCTINCTFLLSLTRLPDIYDGTTLHVLVSYFALSISLLCLFLLPASS